MGSSGRENEDCSEYNISTVINTSTTHDPIIHLSFDLATLINKGQLGGERLHESRLFENAGDTIVHCVLIFSRQHLKSFPYFADDSLLSASKLMRKQNCAGARKLTSNNKNAKMPREAKCLCVSTADAQMQKN